MIGRPECTLILPPPCPTNRDHLNQGRRPIETTAQFVGLEG